MTKKDHDLEDGTIFASEKIAIKNEAQKTQPCLIQISGEKVGFSYQLTEKNMKIGRDSECQIFLNDPHVSAVHAELVIESDVVTIRDLQSTNGVFVNGTKVTEQILKEGDRILIGTHQFFKLSFQDTIEQNYQKNLYQAAIIDNLTQLYNKKYFEDILIREFSFSRRSLRPLSLMMLDIDFFKKINDDYGHLAGDVVLRSLGTHLKKHVRLENVACRFGGEEFAVILRDCRLDQAYVAAERVRKEIENNKVKFQDQEIHVTLSIGLSTYTKDNFQNTEEFIADADKSLYLAKNNGRNQVVPKPPE